MADVVSPQKRSEMMSGIRGKNTRPELLIRSLLHRAGYRYRLHVKTLPGKPDIVLPKYKAVILVHGCFWHGHDCSLFKWPQSRVDFWKSKILTNKVNDARAQTALTEAGWRILVIWECALKGKARITNEDILGRISLWLEESLEDVEIRGA